MNPFEFVITIIVLGLGYKLIAVWMQSRALSRSNDESANASAALMQQRLEQLEERVRVLERIVTDDRFELKQQFKDLAR